ncbi:MAG: ABC transporter permease [Cyanobacteria bacterium REEB67]|nr:ABC transporter permease [Cyanobacteria bacterium REEB67]
MPEILERTAANKKDSDRANSSFETSSLSHLWALVLKETREIIRNPYLLFLIIVPPTIQLLILGGALDPQVRNLTLGVVDHCHSRESRDLLSSLTNSGVFTKNLTFKDESAVSEKLTSGNVDVAIVVPEAFSRDLQKGVSAPLQVLVDGANAYSAGIASAYVLRTVNAYKPTAFQAAFKANIEAKIKENVRISARQPRGSSLSRGSSSPGSSGASDSGFFGLMKFDAARLVDPIIDILYNPGQLASWFFVPGVLGASLTLTSTLVASAAVLRERESGTMEQLLMTPAETWEILLAKVVPLVAFLLADVCMAIGAAAVVFHLPFRGNFLLFLLASSLYIFVGIGFGMLLGTLCNNQRQSQLTSFFINIPLILLSGSVVPLDTMPAFLQAISIVDPLRYYVFIARAIILKGDGLSILWPEIGALVLFALLLIAVSANRFNRQTV